eukprot:jgi/Chlat1/9144/Chrsp97S08394
MAGAARPVTAVLLLAVLLAVGGVGRWVSASTAAEPATTGRRVLVLADDLSVQATHSKYLAALKQAGYSLTITTADDSSVELFTHGEAQFDKLVVFAPTTESTIEVADVLAFVDGGGDAIIALAPGASEWVRDVVAECGVDLDEDGYIVVDHAAEASKADHTLLAADPSSVAARLLGESLTSPVLFRGIAQSISPESELVVTVVSASPTAYSWSHSEDATPVARAPTLAGSSIALVTAMQARNGARVIVSGSLDLFSDALFTAPKSSNEKFAVGLTKWAFHERGWLRAHSVVHRRAFDPEGSHSPSMYRINDRIHYEVQIEEWDAAKRAWRPFRADDVQLEFVMLDPYIRTTLSQDGKGKFFTTFESPDVYGVFKFVLDYRRVGYTHLQLSTQVPVRPFRHNEYERFIPSAFPYYASAFSMMGGFVIFGLAFLYHK